MMPFNLTQELVDLIVDHVADLSCVEQKDYVHCPPLIYSKEFKNYALISKAFTPRVQKYIFSTVRITGARDDDGGPGVGLYASSQRSLNRLLVILARKPFLAAHIRTIRTGGVFGPLATRHESVQVLLNLMRAHGNPRYLVIQARPIRLREFPEYSFQIDDNAFHLPELVGLYCNSGAHLPMAFICNNPALEILNLISCKAVTVDEPYDSLLARIARRPKLRQLHLKDSMTVIDRLTMESASGLANPPGLVDFSSLESLSVVFTSELRPGRPISISGLKRIISIAGPSLRDLSTSTMTLETDKTECIPLVEPLDLSSCTMLRHIKLHTALHNPGVITYFDNLIHTLDTISRFTDTIETLSVKVYIITDMDQHRSPSLFASLRWEELDHTLEQIFRRQKRQVSCGLFFEFIHAGVHERDEGYKDIVRECKEMVDELKSNRFCLIQSHNNVRVDIEYSSECDFYVGF